MVGKKIKVQSIAECILKPREDDSTKNCYNCDREYTKKNSRHPETTGPTPLLQETGY
jgi:hypothetical protein